MKTRSNTALYLLLALLAFISVAYCLAGAVALREEFFHASRYPRAPFDFRSDGQTLTRLEKEAKRAGLSETISSYPSTDSHSPAVLRSTICSSVLNPELSPLSPSALLPAKHEPLTFPWPPVKVPTLLSEATLPSLLPYWACHYSGFSSRITSWPRAPAT